MDVEGIGGRETHFPVFGLIPPSGMSRLSPAPEAAEPAVTEPPGNFWAAVSSMPDSCSPPSVPWSCWVVLGGEGAYGGAIAALLVRVGGEVALRGFRELDGVLVFVGLRHRCGCCLRRRRQREGRAGLQRDVRSSVCLAGVIELGRRKKKSARVPRSLFASLRRQKRAHAIIVESSPAECRARGGEGIS